MKRKRKGPVTRARRSPYERSLEYATKRLAKATEEHAQCQAKLEALNKEIPYLQTVIRALTPVEQRQVIRPSQYAPKSIFTPANIPAISINVDELPSEEDQFLNVTIPGEKEVLP